MTIQTIQVTKTCAFVIMIEDKLLMLSYPDQKVVFPAVHGLSELPACLRSINKLLGTAFGLKVKGSFFCKHGLKIADYSPSSSLPQVRDIDTYIIHAMEITHDDQSLPAVGQLFYAPMEVMVANNPNGQPILSQRHIGLNTRSIIESYYEEIKPARGSLQKP